MTRKDSPTGHCTPDTKPERLGQDDDTYFSPDIPGISGSGLE